MNVETFYPIFQSANAVEIDSRNIRQNDIFFAFSGENFNAAELAESAVESGAKAVIVEQKPYENSEKNIFYVPSTLEFLQNLAKFHRNRLNIPIIALTGSNGKTTTKELIHSVLEKKFKTQYTLGNLNNHIGVPLTLLSIKPEHEIAVVEMGANHQKEIEFLCEMAQPDFGYVTNFGKAHLEGFGGFEGVIKGKSELYDYLKTHGKIILINENDEIQVRKTENYSRKITFGKPTSDYYFQPFSDENFVGLIFNNEKIQTKLTGNYNFNNLCAAASFGFYFGLNFNEIKTALENYTPTNMRSQIVQKNGKTLILDTYNANPSSMAEALKNFQTFSGTKTAIIGDMLELGDESETEHAEILSLAETLNFDEIITVGNQFKNVIMRHLEQCHPDPVEGLKSFENSQQLADYLKEHKINSENILLKASRGIALEKVLNVL
ncbi:MAG: UDP-N-acetylmuramoyl-tripeptide--D-alanyl-D-alanine ligase [Flavobacteriaceae bacterium]|jgi:UDP-N-acetylmuramoyl-tripeptide--D-alanyl-D-alanine ligase|nr:UDP-N-acetylmuramoyl-tripeptide--D-alanyl-D-alanine ligase [Flavobacteriaceae bacterium]